ncbi:MAG TPA: type II secretion system protein GspJ [Planctomycetota bacterium]|nr:type II secretion system protein GspJ [Planctomycetota bacterium]
MMRIARRTNAFTLLEILVTLSIAVIVIGIAYGSYAASLKSVSICRAKAKADDAACKLLRTITRDLRGTCIPPSTAASEPDDQVVFSAGGATLSFATATARSGAGLPDAGISQVTYHLDPAHGELVRSLRNAGAEDTQVLARGIRSLVFDCFDGSAWHRQWDWGGTKSIPAAIRFAATDDTGQSFSAAVRVTCETAAKAVRAVMTPAAPAAEGTTDDQERAPE